MRALRHAFTAFLAVLAVSAPRALSAQAETVRLTGVGERVVVNGVYVGNYTLATPGIPSLDVYCVDFLNAVRVNDEWDANFSPLIGDLDQTRRGESARNLYHKAAWLTTQFSKNLKREWGAIHAAIWYTMAPNPETVTALRQSNWYRWQGTNGLTTVQYWLNQAEANYRNIHPGNFVIITDESAAGRNTGGKQEYMTVVPEPATMFLVGSGLLGAMGAARKRRKREQGEISAESGDAI